MEDEKLMKFLDEKFAKVDQRFEKVDQRFEKMDQRFLEVGIQFEHLHAEIKQVEEGVQNVGERLDRFHNEAMDHLIDIRSDLRISFHLLNKRVTDLENRHA